MKTIRKGVFETNSSSTHSICICTDEEFKAWGDNEIFENYGDFITAEELLIEVREQCPNMTDEEILIDVIRNPWKYDVRTFDSWDSDMETDYTTYTTKSGERLHILCRYGFDS